MISVTGGLEVAVQQIARIEEEIVMVRGRIAGQAENGRLFLLPFDRINGVYVNRAVALEEVELFSPTVSLQRKEEVAKIVAALAEKARQEATAAEQAAKGKDAPQTDLKRQLEELREKAGFGTTKLATTPGPANALPGPSGPGTPSPSAAPAPAATGGGFHGAPTGVRPSPALPTAPSLANSVQPAQSANGPSQPNEGAGAAGRNNSLPSRPTMPLPQLPGKG